MYMMLSVHDVFYLRVHYWTSTNATHYTFVQVHYHNLCINYAFMKLHIKASIASMALDNDLNVFRLTSCAVMQSFSLVFHGSHINSTMYILACVTKLRPYFLALGNELSFFSDLVVRSSKAFIAFYDSCMHSRPSRSCLSISN